MYFEHIHPITLSFLPPRPVGPSQHSLFYNDVLLFFSLFLGLDSAYE
jgi:hypothetical protein